MKYLTLGPCAALLAVALAACQPERSTPETVVVEPPPSLSVLTLGMWRGALTVQGQEIPFLFEVKAENGEQNVALHNKGPEGNQLLRCKSVTAVGDSTTVQLPGSDAVLVFRASGDGQLQGAWVSYPNRQPVRVPLTARKALPSDSTSSSLSQRIEGAWQVTFKPQTGKPYPATATFRVDEQGLLLALVTTPTNDYLHLSGRVDDEGNIRLSSFNGRNAVLIKVAKSVSSKDVIKGDFYSSQDGHETWTAVRASNAKRPAGTPPSK